MNSTKCDCFWCNTHTHARMHARTHTHTHQYKKGKTNLHFTEARDSEWQWHQLGHIQVCTSLQADNHASTPLLRFLQAGCPSCRPTISVKALKANCFWCNNRHRIDKYLDTLPTNQTARKASSPIIPKVAITRRQTARVIISLILPNQSQQRRLSVTANDVSSAVHRIAKCGCESCGHLVIITIVAVLGLFTDSACGCNLTLMQLNQVKI